MRKYGFAVVEGPHDVEFVYRLLKPFGFSRVVREEKLDPVLEPLIPRAYPPDGDLQKRMPIPLFLQSDTHALAVHSAQGDTRIVQTVQESLSSLEADLISGIAIILDSDRGIPLNDRYKLIRDGLRDLGLLLEDTVGTIAVGPPRLGAFVLPDNQSRGTLEDLLLECAQHSYPGLLSSAETHVATALADASLTKDDTEDLRKPSGRNKAVIASIGGILRPGKAIQTSIQDNRWLEETALRIPRIKAVQDFLAAVFEL